MRDRARTKNECASVDKSSRDNNRESSGFSIQKIYDKNSIFYGAASLGPIARFIDAYSFVHNLPLKNDYTLAKIAKTTGVIWELFKSFYPNKLLDISKLNEIDFGNFQTTIIYIIENITKPDESTISFETRVERYKIKQGYLYIISDKIYTNNLSKNDITKFIWEKFNNTIKLEDTGQSDLEFVKFNLTKKQIFGSYNKLVQKLTDDYIYFKNNNLSRCYLLIGNPGTGKSGIVNLVTENIKGSILIISGGISSINRLSQITSAAVELNPDFIVLEDCDRSSDHPNVRRAFLDMFESVKERNEHTNFLLTANKFSGILKDDAVTRKGRIDHVFEIAEPDLDDRKEIFKKYIEDFGISISDIDFEQCIDLSNGMTGAEIKELCIQLKKSSISEVFEMQKNIDKIKIKYAHDKSADTDWGYG